MASTLPTFNVEKELIDVEADAAEIQKGTYSTPSFYGDQSNSSSHQTFMSGVNSALSFAGFAATKFELLDERDDETQYRLTKAEFTKLQAKARSIANYSKIPYDTAEDFLIILCFVNNLEDLTKIANAIQLPELANANLIRNPNEILELRGLEKIAFAASALDGLINMFRKYLNAAINNSNSSSSEDISDILSAISNLAGGISNISAIQTRIETAEIGNFLSELITGERIPINVIAKNPMMQSPSYTGKAFFGESPIAIPNVDIDQVFAKAIAEFPKPSSGVGTTSFKMQNFGTFNKIMDLKSFVSKVATGSSTISSTRKQNQINKLVTSISDFTGATENDLVEITRADNAIPIMMAMSASFSNQTKSLFSSTSFQDGWALAQSVGNAMYQSNPNFIEAARSFL